MAERPGRANKKFKYGCPYCGKNAGGVPTESGFQWDICTRCLGKLDYLEEHLVQEAEASRPPRKSTRPGP